MLVRTFLYLEVIKSEIDQNAKNIIQTHVHLPIANEIASGLLAKMSAVSQTSQTKQKKKIPQRRIVEAGHREKDKADLARGHEKRLSKNRGTYRPRWRSWVQFRSVPFLFLAKTFANCTHKS